MSKVTWTREDLSEAEDYLKDDPRVVELWRGQLGSGPLQQEAWAWSKAAGGGYYEQAFYAFTDANGFPEFNHDIEALGGLAGAKREAARKLRVLWAASKLAGKRITYEELGALP